jgi:Phage derived protein Gp49-like (DUF891)
MRLVRIGRAVWEVLAIEDEHGQSVWDELKKASDAGDGAAIQMCARLKTKVPEGGPPRMNRTQCRSLGDDIYEFKEAGWRVLWFYDAGKTVICTHSCGKLSNKKLQQEIKRAVRISLTFFAAKSEGDLVIADLSVRGGKDRGR